MYLSPNHRVEDFPQPLCIDDKITIFEDQIFGWKLGIANQLINGKKKKDGTKERPPIPDSGYAVLDIVISYFEMIGKYQDGYTGKGQSRKYFNQGFFIVYPPMKNYRRNKTIQDTHGKNIKIVDYLLDILYEGVRCSLYHSGGTSGLVISTSGVDYAITLDAQDKFLMINPHLLVPELINHFVSYIQDLRDLNNTDLRMKFEARFDFDSQV
jgi:hypothetical protein